MGMRWFNTLAAAIALAAQGVAAQPPTVGCPAGQAVQSVTVGGHPRITCVPVVTPAALQAETAARQAADAAETTARQAMDANILSMLAGLTEADIVGRWAMSGTTTCLQSSNGFNANFSPLVPATGSTNVSQLTGTLIGTRTFNADGTGRGVATAHSLTLPGAFYGATFSGIGGPGGATVVTLDAGFTWSIQPDGTLLIDDDNSVPQTFTAPPSRVGSTVTAENVPSFSGYISKDRRTITLTHPGMSIETSVFVDGTTGAISRTPRFCARHRVLTRLPD